MYLKLFTTAVCMIFYFQLPKAAGVCNNGDIRLVNGNNQFEGRVEVCLSNVWGTVCDDNWKLTSSRNAEVACRQLGHSDMGAEAVAGDPNNFRLPPFGQGTGLIFWDDVSCTGSEQRLEDCPHLTTPEGSTDCTHSEDIGVRCQPLPQETTAIHKPTTLSVEQTTAPEKPKGTFSGVEVDKNSQTQESVSTTSVVTTTDASTPSFISPLSEVNVIFISVIAGGVVTAIIIVVVLLLVMLYVCIRCRSHHEEKGVKVDLNPESKVGEGIVISNSGAVPGSGEMETNMCYETTLSVKREIRPKLTLSPESIETRATTWNVAYETVPTGFRQNLQEANEYETISDAAVGSRHYYNNRQFVTHA